MNCSYIVVEIFACLSDPKSCVVWERDSQGNAAKGQGWCDFWSPIKTIKIHHNRYQALASKSAHLLTNIYFFSIINTLESFLIVILFILYLFLFTLTQKNRRRLCDDDCKSSAF